MTAQPDIDGNELNFYVGDIHNHCDISYGIGSLEDALQNAKAQVDFASVTGHAWWHDMPTDERLKEPIEVHRQGFERLASQWDEVLARINSHHVDGSFVTFPSFEWHSIEHGDRCVYYRDGNGPIIRANSLDELHEELRTLRGAGIETLAIPHHTAYGRDNRGLKWSELDEDLNPVVEIVSTHGAADLGVQRPYLLPIGARDYGGSLQEGLASDARFGVIGSTDNHAGFPGSFGFGRIGVWASELTREAIWEGIVRRRTVALTGNRVEVMLAGNGSPMGSVLTGNVDRELAVTVSASAGIETVDLLKDGELFDRRTIDTSIDSTGEQFVIPVWVGWSSQRQGIDWDVEVMPRQGRIVSVEPHFRGPLHVDAHNARTAQLLSAGTLDFDPERSVARLRASTKGNASSVENDSQGFTLTLAGPLDAEVEIRVADGPSFTASVSDLLVGERSFNPWGYAGGAIQVGPAVPRAQCQATVRFVDTDQSGSSYQARIQLRNSQWAWSSPIWYR